MSNDMIIGALGLVVVLLAHTVIVSRWSARVQTVIEKVQEEIIILRKLTTEHAKIIERHDVLLEEGRDSVRRGFGRRHSDHERGSE